MASACGPCREAWGRTQREADVRKRFSVGLHVDCAAALGVLDLMGKANGGGTVDAERGAPVCCGRPMKLETFFCEDWDTEYRCATCGRAA